MKKEEVYGHIDHTLLKAFSTTEQIEAIAEEALKYGTASICIPASFVNYIHNKYKDVNICTVIGFPLGYSTTSIKVAEAKQAIEDGANEIDMVINIGWAKEHKFDAVTEEIKAVKAACRDKILKVIIETCYLTDEEKIALCKCVSDAKADYIKTSTGFGTGGATLEDVKLLKANVAPYDKEGIDSSKIIVDKNSDTGAALIIVNEATGQNEIIVIIGACGEFKPEEVQALKETVASAGTVLCQLETNPEATYKVLDMAKQAGVTTVFNPAPARKLPDEVLNGIDYITPNETEAEIITGIAVTGYESAAKAADVLLGKGVKNVVITLGNKGYYAKNAQSEFTGAPIQVNVVDTTGAGDAFNGGFTAALAAGMSFEAALIYGNVTGGLAVEKLGTAPAMPYKEEIMAALNK